MSTTDKNDDKLAASVRRSKASATKPAQEGAEAKPAAPAPTVKKTAKKVVAKAKPPAKPKPAAEAPQASFQAAKRVWPD